MSGSLLRLFLLGSAVIVVYFVIMRPQELRRMGRGVRLFGLVYVAAVVLSSVLRLTVGWGA